ncbi:MAG: ATP-dependent zinc metalloprotease FtsH, partial [Brevundimonas sp.]
AQALLEYETLSGQEINDLLERGILPNRDEANSPVPGPSVSVPVTPVSDGTEVETAKASEAEPVAAPTTSVPTV